MIKKLALFALYVGAEIAIYLGYNDQQASFHWFTHFYVGAIVALIGLSVWKISTHRTVIWPLGWLYLAHLAAMFPDFLYNFGHIAHREWMDIFLGHISSHYILGRNWTWYILFMFAFAGYLLVSDNENKLSYFQEKHIPQS